MDVRGVNFREERTSKGAHGWNCHDAKFATSLAFPRTIFLVCWALLARSREKTTVVVKIS